jgi:hypothetical protein
MNNVNVKAILDGDCIIVGDININGYDNILDFLDNHKSGYLNLTNVIFKGTEYNTFLLNRKRVIGYIP